MLFTVSNALLDASISCWDIKRAYASVRPISAIHYLYNNSDVSVFSPLSGGLPLHQPIDAMCSIEAKHVPMYAGDSIRWTWTWDTDIPWSALAAIPAELCCYSAIPSVHFRAFNVLSSGCTGVGMVIRTSDK